MSKARVAPIKPMSIPCMELTAAVVSANVTAMLKRELDYRKLTVCLLHRFRGGDCLHS